MGQIKMCLKGGDKNQIPSDVQQSGRLSYQHIAAASNNVHHVTLVMIISNLGQLRKNQQNKLVYYYWLHLYRAQLC